MVEVLTPDWQLKRVFYLITALRECFGIGFVDAKDIIDNLPITLTKPLNLSVTDKIIELLTSYCPYLEIELYKTEGEDVQVI